MWWEIILLLWGETEHAETSRRYLWPQCGITWASVAVQELKAQREGPNRLTMLTLTIHTWEQYGYQETNHLEVYTLHLWNERKKITTSDMKVGKICFCKDKVSCVHLCSSDCRCSHQCWSEPELINTHDYSWFNSFLFITQSDPIHKVSRYADDLLLYISNPLSCNFHWAPNAPEIKNWHHCLKVKLLFRPIIQNLAQ